MQRRYKLWAAFMKKAVQLPQYSDVHEFHRARRAWK